MKIGIFADPHDSSLPGTTPSRRPELSRGKMRRALEVFSDCELIICLGDMIDSCGQAEATAAYLRDSVRLITDSGREFICLAGNHDCANFSKAEFFAAAGLEPPPFSRKIGSTLLVFLDANFRNDGSAYCPGNAEWTDTVLPRDQVDALKKLCDGTDAEKIIVFSHQCLDPNVEKHHIVSNAEAVREILASCPKTCISYAGHYHAGFESIIDGVRYTTVGGMIEEEQMPLAIEEI